MSVTNYLKKYPYLFVRESDQTNYLCTLCDTYVKESDLQLHILEKHKATDSKGNFVKVTIDPKNLTLPEHKNFIYVCVVCWSKLSSVAEMSLHTIICKLSGQDAVSGPKKTNNGSDSKVSRIVEKMEPTNVVSTPDLYISESDDENTGQGSANGLRESMDTTSSKNSTSMQENTKRGRKKQLHPQQVLPPFRVGESLAVAGSPKPAEDPNLDQEQSLLHCSLCNEVYPSANYMKHLKDFHKVDCSKENNLCPLCLKAVPLAQLSAHFTKSHGVITQTSLNALLLWGLICNTNSPTPSNEKPAEDVKVKSGASQFKEAKLAEHQPKIQPNVVPSIYPLNMNSFMKEKPTHQPLKSLPMPSQSFLPGEHPASIPSFLQSILKGEPQNSQLSSIDVRKDPMNPEKLPLPTKESLDVVVMKLTRKFSDATTEKDSFQCLLCKKWFAIPPVKHMRGHLLNFRELDKYTAPVQGVPGDCHVCLICFQIFDNQPLSELHVASSHGNNPVPDRDQGDDFSHLTNNLKMTLSLRDNASHSTNPAPTANSQNNGLAYNETSFSDPKGVELDNAGRVKSGKVRKQCELCGQWSNIKWFFKHMSEVHKALFCRCCREYLPIQEQEEHRKWHSEPPYMGQKIRLENGHPIIIDRKERASLTPIGSLAAWGGSSGGMVVKAVDDSVISMPRKRKSTNAVSSFSSVDLDGPPMKMNSGVFSVCRLDSIGVGKTGKDTLMPKEICPVCGISITYKNLARHIKLRHKIKYKFCHKCRKLVPNDTYDDHKILCVSLDSSPNHQRSDVVESTYSDSLNGDMSDGTKEVADDETGLSQNDVSDCVNLNADLSSSFSGATPPSSMNGDSGIDATMFDGRKSDSFRANTSKTKLESLLGKEFKHPRRKCSICGYNVSYSNFKRHLRNAHPQEYIQCEKDNPDFGKAIASLCHIVDEENQMDNPSNEIAAQAHFLDIDSMNNFVKCPLCNDHVLQSFLIRHIHTNHPDKDHEEKLASNLKGLENSSSKSEEKDLANNNNDRPVISKPTAQNAKDDKIKSCPECKAEIESDLMVNHCRTVHKVSYKQCPSCEKFINKKAFGTHMLKHNLGERIMTRSSEVDAKNTSTLDDESNNGENIRAFPTIEVDDDDEDEQRLTIDMKAGNDEANS